MHSAKAISQTFAITLGAAISLPALAATNGACIVPQRVEPAVSAKGSSKNPTDAPGIAFQKADGLRRVGQGDDAAAIYRRLVSAPADKRQTSRKALLRLAQYELSNNRFDAAQQLVDSAMLAGANESVRREAAHIRARIRHELAVTQVEVKFSQLEMKRRSSETPATLLPEYHDLLSLGCPYPDDFRFELHDRMASINAESGNFDVARQELAAAEAELSYISGHRVGALREKLIQRRADLDARSAIAAAANDGSEAGKREKYDFVLSSIPSPSPQLRIRAHLLAADSYMRERNFATAAQRIDLASQIPTDGPVPASYRIDQARAKLAERKSDYEFRERLQKINLVRSTDAKRAIPEYRALIDQNPQAPALPQAKIALAEALRQARYYREARVIAGDLGQQQSTPEAAERVVRLQEHLEKSSPDSVLRAQMRIASYYDTNAPTLATELREEEDGINYPLNQRFDDGVVDVDARISHAARISDNYHYWETEIHARKTAQFNLSPMDRFIFDVNSGPAFNLPDQGATLKVAGIFKWESRGGDFLRTNYGGSIAFDKRLSQALEAKLLLSTVHNNDTRDNLDGTHLTLRGSLDFELSPNARLAPAVGWERREVRSAALDNSRFSVGASYSYQWGSEVSRRGIDLNARYQWVRYDRNPAIAPRNDRRFETGIMAWMDISNKVRVFAEYRYNNPSSNYANLERLENSRIGAGLIFAID